MGLAYKPDIDDLRQSPALAVACELSEKYDRVLAAEPNLEECRDLELTPYREAARKADIVVFLVAHRQFRELSVEGKTVLDFCGLGKGRA